MTDDAVGATGDGPAIPPATSDDSPATDYSTLAAALADGEAVAVVHVGDRFDDDLRYLTRFAGPDRDYAFVATADEQFLLAPALFAEQARREFAGTVVTDDVGAPAGLRAARLLDRTVGDDADESGADTGPGTEPTVLVPQQIPHDAVAYLQQAGFGVESTSAVTDARIVKTASEIDHLCRVQRAARRGIRRAATILAESTVAETDADDDETGETDSRPLHWQGAPLSTERLRRQVNATLVVEGVRDAGNTVIGAGETCADLHFTGLRQLYAGETILVDVSPRGPAGYYGDCTRTFVVDGEGGWERRAHVAVTAAREAALDELAAGVPASTVQQEAAAEIAAYGFRIDSDERGFVHGVGHGIGLSLHEGPSFRSDEPLPAGAVVTVEPGVYDPERGGVRVEDVAVVREEGYELVGSLPTGLDAGEYAGVSADD